MNRPIKSAANSAIKATAALFLTILNLTVVVNLTACAGEPPAQPESPAQTEEKTVPAETEEKTVPAETKAPEVPTAKIDILLTSAPPLILTDVLSSADNAFQVHSGNYSWTYQDGEEEVSLAACGSHPLSTDPDRAEKLYVPDYRGSELTSFAVSCAVPPDRLTVREWEISELGTMEAAESSVTTYENTSLIQLKPEQVYEITAVWDEEKLAVNGFCGKASYVVLTALSE